MNMSIFRERKNLEELSRIIGNAFMEYKVVVCDNREIVSVLDRLGLIGQFVAHLGYDDPDGLRYGWFQEKTRIEHQDYHIYVILYNGMEIVATRAWS